MNFADKLAEAVRKRGNAVVVGLDPRLEELPAAILPKKVTPHTPCGAFFAFCREVIEVVADLVPAVKPQAAFFEQQGAHGMQVLSETIAYARERGLLVILDGKRNDIGSTAQAYAEGFLGKESAWGADALTVSPYLGDDSLTPFVETAEARDAGIFVLVKTSNPGGKRFQDLSCEGRPLFHHVAEYVESLAKAGAGECGYGAVGAVAGATYPEQLGELRAMMPHTWFLVPGYGAQGGGAKDVAAAFDENGLGAVVNNSRGIIFAHSRKEYAGRFAPNQWQDAVAAATRDMIDQLRAHTTMGRLA